MTTLTGDISDYNILVIETWKPVNGYEGLYSVSSQGRVRGERKTRDRGRGVTAVVRERILKPHRGRSYDSVSLVKDGSKRTVNVHTIVADAFIGPREVGFCVCHENGDGHDNRVENLRIDSYAQNMKDKLKHGTNMEGEKHHKHILSEDDARYVLKMRNRKTCSELGKQFGVSPSTISKIHTGKNWKCLN